MHRPEHRITVVGGGFAGPTAAITPAGAGATVTAYEAHHTLGGRARTADGPYRTNEGPHALYNGGPHWTWLRRREAVADGRTGAVDLPGTSRRDRPAVDRGDGIHLAGDQVAAPGALSEVSFDSAVTAVSLILGRPVLDLKRP